MQFLKNLVLVQVAAIFIFTQSFALQSESRAALQETMVVDAVANIENEIDQQLDQVAQMDQEDPDASSLDDPTPVVEHSRRYYRIKARWVRKMEAKQESLIENYSDKIDSSNDDELKAEVLQVRQHLAAGNPVLAQKAEQLANSSDLRGDLKKAYAERVAAMAAILPDQIAKAGGALFFVLHLKKNLRELREQMGTKAGANGTICTIANFAFFLILAAAIVFSALFFFGPNFLVHVAALIKIPVAIILTVVGTLVGYAAGVGLDLLACD